MTIEDYFENPLAKSARIEWINSEDIQWGDLWCFGNQRGQTRLIRVMYWNYGDSLLNP